MHDPEVAARNLSWPFFKTSVIVLLQKQWQIRFCYFLQAKGYTKVSRDTSKFEAWAYLELYHHSKVRVRDVCTVRVMRFGECGTEHKVVHGKLQSYKPLVYNRQQWYPIR